MPPVLTEYRKPNPATASWKPPASPATNVPSRTAPEIGSGATYARPRIRPTRFPDPTISRIQGRSKAFSVLARSRSKSSSLQDTLYIEWNPIPGVILPAAHEQVVSRASDHIPGVRGHANRREDRAERREVESERLQLLEHVPLAVVPDPFRVWPGTRKEARLFFVDLHGSVRLRQDIGRGQSGEARPRNPDLLHHGIENGPGTK